MNPLTNMKNVKKLSEQELNTTNKTSWHDQYKDSAWVFVGGLPYDLSEGDVICIFSQFGEIVNINMVRDKETGKTKGFCFLCYEDQRSTVLAVDNLNGIKILKRTIRVDHVQNYKVPKDSSKLDDITRTIQNEGCGPGSSVLTKAASTPVIVKREPSDDVVLPERLPIEHFSGSKLVKKEKKSKKRKKKKKKKSKKRKKASSESSSDSEDDSHGNSKKRKSSDSDSSHEVEEKRVKKSKRKKAESSSDMDSEASHKKNKKGKQEKSNDSSDSDSFDSNKKRSRKRKNSFSSADEKSYPKSRKFERDDHKYKGSSSNRRDFDKYKRRDDHERNGRSKKY